MACDWCVFKAGTKIVELSIRNQDSTSNIPSYISSSSERLFCKSYLGVHWTKLLPCAQPSSSAHSIVGLDHRIPITAPSLPSQGLISGLVVEQITTGPFQRPGR